MQARERYREAYRLFVDGRSKSEVGRHFGVGGERGRQLVNKGYRVAISEGWATKRAY